MVIFDLVENNRLNQSAIWRLEKPLSPFSAHQALVQREKGAGIS
jgi:hypothetical protein